MQGGGIGPETWVGAQRVIAAFLPTMRFNLRSGCTVQLARAQHNTLTAQRVGPSLFAAAQWLGPCSSMNRNASSTVREEACEEVSEFDSAFVN